MTGPKRVCKPVRMTGRSTPVVRTGIRGVSIGLALLLSACEDDTGGSSIALSCDPALAAVAPNDHSELLAEPSRPLAGRGTELVVLAPPSGRALPDVERLMTQLEGLGQRPRMVGAVDDDTVRQAGAIVIASSAYESLVVDAGSMERVEDACAQGVDLVWLGLGIPDRLEDELGVDAAEAAPAREHGVSTVAYGPSSGTPLTYALDPPEWVEPLTPRGAEVLARFDDGRALFTTHRASPSSCRATALPWAFGDYWSEDGTETAWLRAELSYEAMVRGTSSGTGHLELFPAGTNAIFMIRFEDIHPGGGRFHLNNDMFIERFDRVIDWLADFDYHMSLSIVPRFVDPGAPENNGWLDPMEQRPELLAALTRALEGGAALIAHGYTHQNGTRDTDYTGVDWEMSDDTSGEWVFIPYEDQRAKIEASRIELSEVFGFVPRVWETPHLEGNEDTYSAAAAEGFEFVNEEDGNIFPHLIGAGPAINIPHTGSYVGTDAGAEPWARVAIGHVMPRMFRIRAPFFFFYHGYDDLQESALHAAATCAAQAGAWGPTVTELGDRWVARRMADVEVTHVNETTMRAVVRDAPAESLFTFRVPEGHRPREVYVDGGVASFEELRRDGITWARVALPGASAEVELIHGP